MKIFPFLRDTSGLLRLPENSGSLFHNNTIIIRFIASESMPFIQVVALATFSVPHDEVPEQK
jgi:hypothetical protein